MKFENKKRESGANILVYSRIDSEGCFWERGENKFAKEMVGEPSPKDSSRMIVRAWKESGEATGRDVYP